MTPEQAYDEVCRLAREHALIWQAHGGVVVIVHPDTLQKGIATDCRDRILAALPKE